MLKKIFFITPQSKIRLSMSVKRVENRVFYSREESDRSMQMAVSFCPLAHLHICYTSAEYAIESNRISFFLSFSFSYRFSIIIMYR